MIIHRYLYYLQYAAKYDTNCFSESSRLWLSERKVVLCTFKKKLLISIGYADCVVVFAESHYEIEKYKHEINHRFKIKYVRLKNQLLVIKLYWRTTSTMVLCKERFVYKLLYDITLMNVKQINVITNSVTTYNNREKSETFSFR